MYNFFESGGNMMPWQGHTDIMIDKYDVRTLMASLEEPPPLPSSKKRFEEEEVPEGQLNFERFRPLVEAKRIGQEETILQEQVRSQVLVLDKAKQAPTSKDIEQAQRKYG